MNCDNETHLSGLMRNVMLLKVDCSDEWEGCIWLSSSVWLRIFVFGLIYCHFAHIVSYRVFIWAVLERHHLTLQIISVFFCLFSVWSHALFSFFFVIWNCSWFTVFRPTSFRISGWFDFSFFSFHCNIHAFAQKYNGTICFGHFHSKSIRMYWEMQF